ncbi:ras protein let-60 [Pelomyxa schiedti]|nr:ras protein let-60 [Pelomyxa schiedti]
MVSTQGMLAKVQQHYGLPGNLSPEVCMFSIKQQLLAVTKIESGLGLYFSPVGSPVNYEPGIEDYSRKLYSTYNGRQYYMHLCQLEKENPSMNDTIVKQGDAFILVYSVTSATSFNDIANHRDHLLALKSNPVLVLCGNKADLETEREVDHAAGSRLASELGIPFYETSAKTRYNVEQMFRPLIEDLANRLIKPTHANSCHNS